MLKVQLTVTEVMLAPVTVLKLLDLGHDVAHAEEDALSDCNSAGKIRGAMW